MSNQNKIFNFLKPFLAVLILFASMMLFVAHINSRRSGESISSMEDIFNQLGYREINGSQKLSHIRSHQPIGHFPNISFLTNKMHLALTTQSKYIPVSFQFPRLKNEFLYFARTNVDSKFVLKNFDNGGIKIVNFEEIDFQLGTKQ